MCDEYCHGAVQAYAIGAIPIQSGVPVVHRLHGGDLDAVQRFWCELKAL
jgi:hypothetical protein